MPPVDYLKPWVGQACTDIVKHPYAWQFLFGDVGGVYVECPWRIIVSNTIALSASDDGHQFGLPAPLDAQISARGLVVSKVIRSVSISEVADLKIEFDGDTFLELFNNSSGYEAWNASVGGSASLFALGGGEI